MKFPKEIIANCGDAVKREGFWSAIPNLELLVCFARRWAALARTSTATANKKSSRDIQANGDLAAAKKGWQGGELFIYFGQKKFNHALHEFH